MLAFVPALAGANVCRQEQERPAGVVTRIAGGVLRGRRLRVARSKGLRPTSERVRAALFSILGAEAVEGARVLDLFAGTGALGMEALSRGAARADFVEVHGGSCREIRRSLEEFGLGETGRVHRGAVPRALDGLEGGYDLILRGPALRSGGLARTDGKDWRRESHERCGACGCGALFEAAPQKGLRTAGQERAQDLRGHRALHLRDWGPGWLTPSIRGLSTRSTTATWT